MPLPIDTLLRVQASPVPAQIVFGACGSMATAPMDCAASLSKTGLKVVPPFEDFHTPPLVRAALRAPPGAPAAPRRAVARNRGPSAPPRPPPPAPAPPRRFQRYCF